MSISTAISPSQRGRGLGIKTTFQNLKPSGAESLPMAIAVIAEPNNTEYATIDFTKTVVTSAVEAALAFGFSSPIHKICEGLFPANGNGVGSIPVTIYPVKSVIPGGSAHDDGKPTAGTITATGTATEESTLLVNIADQTSAIITIPDTTAAAAAVVIIETAINNMVNGYVAATSATTIVSLQPNWNGGGTEKLAISVTPLTGAGLTYVSVNPGASLYQSDVDEALGKFGDSWETMVLFSAALTAAAIQNVAAFNEGRWGADTRKPFVCFVGDTDTAVPVADAGVDLPANRSNRSVSVLVAPGSENLPFTVAGAELAKIARVVDNDPARDYGSQVVEGATPGIDSVQWTAAQRDAALKLGSSTVKVIDGQIRLCDTITMYHPTGETDPAYRYVASVYKVMNILYALSVEFQAVKWDGAPLIPDGQATTNKNAKRPKDAKAATAGIIDALALKAILSDPDTAKGTIVAGINETNPNRIDLAFTAQISGNVNILSIDLNFAFFFGNAAII